MRQDVKLKGKLKGYTQTPLVLTALFGAMDVWMYVLNIKAGVLGSVFVGIYFFVMLFVYWRNKPILMNELIDFATQYGTVQKRLLNEFEVPYAVMDATGKLLWMNRQFEALSEKNKGYHKSITTIFPQITRELMEKEDELELVVEREECVYRASVHKIHFTDILHESSSIELTEKVQYLQVIYLFDETQLTRYRIENQEMQMVPALVYIDNYDEVLDTACPSNAPPSSTTAFPSEMITFSRYREEDLMAYIQPDSYRTYRLPFLSASTVPLPFP